MYCTFICVLCARARVCVICTWNMWILSILASFYTTMGECVRAIGGCVSAYINRRMRECVYVSPLDKLPQYILVVLCVNNCLLTLTLCFGAFQISRIFITFSAERK